MTSNLLVYIFFALFIIFLVESIYYLKNKIGEEQVELTNESNQQKSGKLSLIGGLVIILLIIVVSGYLLLSRQNTPFKSSISNVSHTANPTQILPSPTPKEIVYNFPTVTQVPISPIATPTINVSPTKKLSPTITLVPTITPKPTKSPTSTPTHIPTKTPTPKIQISASLSPVISTLPSIILTSVPSPAKSPLIGAPNITISPTMISQATPSTASAVIIVPKLPVAGSIEQTLSIFFFGILSVLAGLFL